MQMGLDLAGQDLSANLLTHLPFEVVAQVTEYGARGTAGGLPRNSIDAFSRSLAVLVQCVNARRLCASIIVQTRIDLRVAMMERRTVARWYVTEGSDDATLVTAARDGDRDAFGCLYSRYSRMVHGILLARVSFADVDDLVQDVFVHAFRRLHDLNDATRFGGWLAAIARSRANDHRRRLQTATAVKQVLAMREAEAPRMSHPTEISAEKILELIRTLPDTYRETLILRLVEGLTGPEIAAHTGLTTGSVRVNLHRGMQQLREKMCRSADGSGSELPPRTAGAGWIARWKHAVRKRKAR